MTDIAQTITDTIIEQLEQGVRPWQKPWNDQNTSPFVLPKNATTGNYYRGINIPLLWMSADAGQYASPEWASYRQWIAAGEAVAKGSKGTTIIYYDTFEKEDEKGEARRVPFIKSSYVFNRCQLVSYEAEEQLVAERAPLVDRIAAVDTFVSNTKALIAYRNAGACYVPSLDKIYMPQEADFVGTATRSATEGFYGTLLHELSHWSGHEKRCNRKLEGRFGSQSYAAEELIAELSAAFLCAALQISNEPRADHASYLASWLKVLKDDKRAILTAASEASKAMDYLQGLQMPEPA